MIKDWCTFLKAVQIILSLHKYQINLTDADIHVNPYIDISSSVAQPISKFFETIRWNNLQNTKKDSIIN